MIYNALAVKASGCPVDLSRHIQCDMCQSGKNIEHAGGFDAVLNQVILVMYVSGSIIRYLDIYLCE